MKTALGHGRFAQFLSIELRALGFAHRWGADGMYGEGPMRHEILRTSPVRRSLHVFGWTIYSWTAYQAVEVANIIANEETVHYLHITVLDQGAAEALKQLAAKFEQTFSLPASVTY